MSSLKNDNTLTSPDEVILDSRTIELNRYFGEIDSLPQLLVLVEDEDDKIFWHKIFSSCVGSLYSSIDVWPLKEAAQKAQQQTDACGAVLTATGKDALMKVTGLGRNKMVAVDADYDLFIDNLHGYTNRIRSEKYIQHTVFYSIENHLLDNHSITALPELSTMIAIVKDYVYAIIAEIMLHLQELANNHCHTHAITIEKLNSSLGSLQYKSSTFEQALRDILSKNFNFSPSSLPLFNAAKALCFSNGYDESNLWKIIQGHTLYEFVEKVMSSKMLKERKNQEAQIRKDESIPGPEKAAKISELKQKILSDFQKEEEKFRNDVYSGKYMNITSPYIQSIQQKILDDLNCDVTHD